MSNQDNKNFSIRNIDMICNLEQRRSILSFFKIQQLLGLRGKWRRCTYFKIFSNNTFHAGSRTTSSKFRLWNCMILCDHAWFSRETLKLLVHLVGFSWPSSLYFKMKITQSRLRKRISWKRSPRLNLGWQFLLRFSSYSMDSNKEKMFQ